MPAVAAMAIGTEYEPAKAAAAARTEHFEQASGLSQFIDLREGGFCGKPCGGRSTAPVDFMLVDIWIGMARPALELVAPRLRLGRLSSSATIPGNTATNTLTISRFLPIRQMDFVP